MMMKKRLSKEDKISFIIKNELMITEAVLGGHQPRDNDEFKEIRDQIKKYRIQLGLIKK
jgi:hypothetical protein